MNLFGPGLSRTHIRQGMCLLLGYPAVNRRYNFAYSLFDRCLGVSTFADFMLLVRSTGHYSEPPRPAGRWCVVPVCRQPELHCTPAMLPIGPRRDCEAIIAKNKHLTRGACVVAEARMLGRTNRLIRAAMRSE